MRGANPRYQMFSGYDRPKLALPALLPAKTSTPGKLPVAGFARLGSMNETWSYFSLVGVLLPDVLVFQRIDSFARTRHIPQEETGNRVSAGDSQQACVEPVKVEAP